jgi:AAA domain/DnaB-like helicase N terminal domain
VTAASAQVPPVNVEAEESVLGAMLVAEPALTRVISQGLLAGDFYLDRHRILFAAIVAMHSAGKPVDELSVANELAHRGQLEEAGGKHYVSELAAKVPAAGNAAHYAEIVQEHATLRRLLGAGQEIQESIHNRNGAGPDELHRRAAELLAAVTPAAQEPDWLADAGELLAQPDPGPMPFLIDRLLLEGAIAALVGAYKRGKTWLLLDMAISVASGRPLFGEFEATQGPVVLIVEESGERALHHRLAMLTRGRAVAGAELREHLHYAANRRVRLDDPAWRGRLIATVERLEPKLLILDPLVRVKGNADENSQAEMAPVLDFLRDLREAGGGAVLFSHHTGHDNRGRMRGTSDLEGYWESKLVLNAEEGSALVDLRAQHREAEDSPQLRYRRVSDDLTDSLRLVLVEEAADAEQDALEELLSAVRFKPGRSCNELAKAVGKRRQDTASRLKKLEEAGDAVRGASQVTDVAGRRRTVEGWFPAEQSEVHRVPENGTQPDAVAPEGPARPASRPLEGGNADAVASPSLIQGGVG